ncbi:uncharacterized protein BXZ73DRAFT_81981 [Epithele typhae]|uniref:uncharacterized protein n=1 Tax=Epithele typhae TaxID=378194 RepID=UPI0020089FC5|nr:uncharacterized protein BXZ73DRAFT_81981 [Epithele typhae]KAH9913126.1 hypothetical protein BXZ73DRAFT_81981 [Epithele typhae]
MKTISTNINHFPPELLLLVFKFSVWGNPKAAVILSHVCGVWRALTLTTASLWTELCVWSPAALPTVLERSRGGPVTYCPRAYPRAARPATQQTVRQLVATSARLQNLECEWSQDAVHQIHHLQYLFGLPSLPALQAVYLEAPIFPALPRTPSFQVDLPVLQEVILDRLSPVVLGTRIKPMLNALAFAGHGGLRSSHLYDLLASAPSLKNLIMEDLIIKVDHSVDVGVFRGGQQSYNRPALTLPVDVLEWSGLSDCALLRGLFRMFEMPQLSALWLTIKSQPTHNSMSMSTRVCTCGVPAQDPHECPKAPWNDPKSVFTFSNLRSLSIVVTNAKFTPSFGFWPVSHQLSGLSFPALEELELVCDADFSPQVFPRRPQDSIILTPGKAALPLPSLPFLFTSMSRNGPEAFRLPRLKLLHLEGFILDTTAAGAFLSWLPAVENLILTSCPGAGDFVCALAPGTCTGGHWGAFHGAGPHARGRWVAPRLRRLVVAECDDVRAACVRRVVAARARVSRESENEACVGELLDEAGRVGEGLPCKLGEFECIAPCAGISLEDVVALVGVDEDIEWGYRE